MKIAQLNNSQETETPLYNGRKITIINFHAINQFGNALNYTEIPFLQNREKDAYIRSRTQEI